MDDSISTARFFDAAIEGVAKFKVADGRSKIRILDFGTGSGRIAKELATIGYDVYGCDIIAPPADIDPDRSRQIQFNPYRLPYDNDMFDVVMSTSVLEHARNPEEYLPEMRRVLKPGGVAMHLLRANGICRTNRISSCLSRISFIRTVRHGGLPCGLSLASARPARKA